MTRWSNILDMGLQFLGYIYQRPGDGRKAVVISMCLLLVTIYSYYLIIIQIMHFNGDINILASCMESLSSFSQVSVKLIPLLIYRDNLGKLLESTKRFWDPQDFPDKTKDVEYLYRTTYYFQMVYKYSVLITLILLYVQPMLRRQLLVILWIPDYPYAFEILLVGQYVYAGAVCCYMLGFDSLYVSFCTHLCVQLRLLNTTIQNISMTDVNYLEKFKLCIDQHRFLISFTEEIQRVYNISLLGQYMVTILLTCMELYMLTESISLWRVLLSASYVGVLLFQMGLYCIPADSVTDEFLEFASHVYASKWYEGTVSQQKQTSFIILQAQREIQFTAAGFANINREAFTQIFKTSMSVYTLMQNFKKE